MADNGDLNYGVGVDVSQAAAELQKLKTQINATTANLQQSQGTIEAAVKRMTADIQKSITTAKAGSDQLLASLRRLDRVQGNTLSSQGRGSFGGQTTAAAGNQLINEARNTAENVTARITNELINQFTQKMRTMDRMVEARLRRASNDSDRFLANNAPDVMMARNTLADRNNQNAIRRAGMTDAQFGMQNTMERIGSNGGADIIAVQARLIAGYQALNLAMNAISGTAQFVVQLDSEFRQFQAITATTNFEMIALKDNLISVSEASKFTALEIAQAATIMGQAGLSAQEVSDSIGSVAVLATAAGSSLSESVDVVTSTMSIFNLQTSQAADVANTLTAALNLSKLSMDKLVLGFQYAGNTAAQMGVTYQELTGVLGALANSGIRSGSTLGTGLRQLLIDIQNPSKELLATLKELGLTQEDVNVENNGLINVLKTLKENGFGAAQAFETLEVRAAAAYAALSNNTDLAVELQQQFILSSAAAEANAIQMESLANTYAKFQSVVGTVAYNAFEPLIEVLQEVLNGFADFLAGLNKYPAALNILAVAFTALGTAMTLTLGLATLRGIIGAATGFSTLSIAVNGATTSFGLLNAVMKLNPAIFLLSGIAALAVGIQAFGNDSMDAAERVDVLKGQLNTLNGEASEVDSQLEAIDQTISNLIKQKAALDRDPLMRSAKILEVKQAFKEISSEVDTTTGSVDELIAALTKLATTDFSKLGVSIRETIAGNEALLAGYEQLYQSNSEQAPKSLYGEIGTFQQLGNANFATNSGFAGIQGSRDNFGFGTFVPDARDTEEYKALILEQFNTSFGPRIAEFAGMIFDTSLIPDDVSNAQAVTAEIRTRIKELTGQQIQLEGDARLGTITPEGVEQLKNIPLYLNLLNALNNGLEPLVTGKINIASRKSEIDLQRNDLLGARVGEVLSGSTLYQERQTLEADIVNRRNEIGRNASNMTADQLLEAYSALDTEFTDRIQALITKSEEITAGLVNEGFSKEEILGATGSFTNPLASLQAQVSTSAKKASVDVQALREEVMKQELKVLDDAIQLQINDSTRASSKAELDVIENYLREKFDLKRKMTQDIFDAQIAQETDDSTIRGLQAELRAEQSEINRAEQVALRSLNDDRREMTVSILEDQKAAIDADIKVMQSKLDQLVQQIAKASPGPVMDALIAQWHQVAQAQQLLISESNMKGISADLLGTPATAPSAGQAGKANQAMKILMELGYNQAQAAGIVGNLMAESNLNSTARGDGGMAYGIGQWHPDRQALLEQFAMKQGTTKDNFETQVRFIDWEMQNSPGTAGKTTYAQLKNQNTAEGAADTFRRLYERPSADPLKGNHAGRIGFAKGLMGTDYTGQAANDNENTTDLNTGIATGTLKGIKGNVAVNVGAYNQQIQAITAQAAASQTPDNIKAMIDSVNTLYNQIIAEKTREFNAENAEAIKAGDPTILAERESLLEGLKADQNQKISSMLEVYWKAVDEKIQEPLEDAQRALEEAQKPENAGKFTQADILGLENNVRIAERKVLTDQLAAAEAYLLEVRSRLAETEAGSAENNHWLLEEARALEIVTELTRGKNTADAVTAQQGPSVAAAIASATQAWAMQNGVLDELGKQVPLAKQVENAWGGVLDTLTTGFSTLFMDLAKGTMTAEEAFKKFALSVIDSFMQMIAKALAMQVVMALMGGEKGGGMGDWIGTLLGVVAPAANGEYIKGAASGEIIPGFSNRDSVLRKVMPGEMILRRSAVDSIGQGALENLNNMGSRTISGEGPEMPANDNPATPGNVNVWVVTPDQVPQAGPNDIIAAVADNIQRRGSLKTLIQQVQMGSV